MRKSGPPAAARPSDAKVERAQAVTNPWTSWWWWVLVLAPVLFNAIWLTPELRTDAPSPNDSALHLLMIHGASDAVAAANNPLDFWIPQMELGFPQFLYYQNFPHLVVVALHRLALQRVEVETIFHVVQYLLLVTFPLTVAWSMRRMGFSAVATGVGAAAASLLSANLRFGFEYNSYIWRGLGLYTQLWGMHLSFIALACLTRTVNDGGGYVRTALALALLALSHLVYAYMMVVTSVLVLVVGMQPRSVILRTTRLLVVGTIACCLAAYMLWPFLESSRLYLNNLPELGGAPKPKARALLAATQGALLDYARLPVLTVLAGIGTVAAAVRRGPARVLGLCGILVWLVLYLGRPTFGPLGDLLPSHAGFISFRFIGAVGMFSILMIGVGGEALWDAIARLRVVNARWHPAIMMLVFGLALSPAVIERARTYSDSKRLIEDTRTALESDAELRMVLASVANQPGRIFSGPRTGWANLMRVGPKLTVADVVNAARLPSIGSPLQGLALNSALLLRFRDGDAGLYDAFNVRTIITPASATVPPFFQSVLRTSRYAVWRVETTGIAHFVEVTGRRLARTQRELYVGASDWLVSGAPGAHQVTRWDYPASGESSVPFTPRPRCADGGRTLEENVGSQRIAVVVECASASALALKMSYHPNWRARVDGAKVQTYMVSPSFLAIDLPAGRHRVELDYIPTASKTPLLAFGVLVLVVAIVSRRRLDAPARWIAGRYHVTS